LTTQLIYQIIGKETRATAKQWG